MERDGKRPHYPQSPGVFQVLRDCGALRVLFPEIDALLAFRPLPGGIRKSTPVFTPYDALNGGDAESAGRCPFRNFCHDLGKGLTPPELWPRHHGQARRVLS